MKRVICLITLLLTVSLAVRNAQATPVTLTAFLSGPNESPPNASPATGFAVVIVDPAAETLSISVTFSGLTSNTQAAHIHCCVAPPGTVGVATTVPAFPGFPLGVTSGTYNSQVFDLTQSLIYNPAFVTANGGLPQAEAALIAGLLGGRTYLNIHTVNFPGGEIRGFLVPVPEPDSLYLLGFGFLLLSIGLARAANKKSPTRV